MTAHELARKLLEGPDLPVQFPWGEHGDPEDIGGVMLIENGECKGRSCYSSHNNLIFLDNHEWEQRVPVVNEPGSIGDMLNREADRMARYGRALGQKSSS